MRLICNGVALDLKSGATLSFKKVNPLFAFDALTCERTQSFDIPATPNNERVFSLAKLPAFSGDGMRRRFNCELQDGTVVKQGYLYVDSYTHGTYKGIFVTGELMGLLNVKNAGKISEIWNPTQIAVFGSTEYNADFASVATDSHRYDNIKYRRAVGYVVPSFSIDYMVQQVAQILHVSVNTPASSKNMRIVPPIPHSLKERTITISNRKTGVAPVTDDDPHELFNKIDAGINDVLETNEFVCVTYGRKGDDQYYFKDWNYLLGTLLTKQDVVFKFPDNFPENVFLCRIIDATNIEFLGGYSFDKSEYSVPGETYDDKTGECVTLDVGNTKGEPLAGRSVEVPADSHILFMTRKDYCHSMFGEDYYYKNDWAFDLGDYDYTVKIKGVDEVVRTRGSIVRLADNLPDITFMELLKAIAYVTGKQINYTDKTGITFDDLNFDTWQTFDVTGKALDVSDITRRFGDYAQRNDVVFAEDNLLFADEQLTQQYTVPNENIAETRELAKIPFSPASYIIEEDMMRAYVRNGVEETGEEYTPEKFMLMQSNGVGGDIYMHRVDMAKNAGIQQLCNASTSLTIKVRMTLAEYESIQAKTALLYAGTRYVWTEATWQNNVCTCKISKI